MAGTKKKPWPCRLGLHDWLGIGNEQYTDPPRGPFDPRNDEQRTFTRAMEICCSCGDKREEVRDDISIPF